MPSNDSESSTQLAKPGAGIPWLEQKLVNVVLRLVSSFKNKDALADMFLEESDRIISLVDPLDDALLSKQVLIDRIRGIEDSSRNWSAMMVLEHLNIVNQGLLGVIQTLLSNKDAQSLPKIDIATVKPSPDVGVEMIDAFAINNQEFLDEILHIPTLKSSATHSHPWFGKLNAKQWLCLIAMHMRVHRKQIEAILDAVT